MSNDGATARDRYRATEAAATIIDGRDLDKHFAEVLVTLEHTLALVLLAVMKQDGAKACKMLNEGLVPGVEYRIAHYENKRRG